jgi:hypothetical protein
MKTITECPRCHTLLRTYSILNYYYCDNCPRPTSATYFETWCKYYKDPDSLGFTLYPGKNCWIDYSPAPGLYSSVCFNDKKIKISLDEKTAFSLLYKTDEELVSFINEIIIFS